MRSREAFGQPLEPPPGFVPDPAAAADLPAPSPEDDEFDDDIVGDGPPEHSWPGTAFVWTFYAAGILSVLRVLTLFVDVRDAFTWTETLALVPMWVLPGAVMIWVARMIQEFKLVGYGVAMALLVVLLASSLGLLWVAEDVLNIGFGVLGVGLAILWFLYLWNRRSDFT